VQGYKLEHQFLVQSNCPVDGILENDYLGERKRNIDYKNQIIELYPGVFIPFDYLNAGSPIPMPRHGYPSSSSSDDSSENEDEIPHLSEDLHAQTTMIPIIIESSNPVTNNPNTETIPTQVLTVEDVNSKDMPKDIPLNPVLTSEENNIN
jgi:hypothetical protein